MSDSEESRQVAVIVVGFIAFVAIIAVVMLIDSKNENRLACIKAGQHAADCEKLFK